MLSRIKHFFNRIKEGRLKTLRAEIRWVYSYAKIYVGLIIIYTLLGLSGTVVSLISSLVSRDLVDIITGHQTGELLKTFCAMIGITLGSAFISQISSLISTKINIRVSNSIKADVFEKIMSSEWEALSDYHSGDLMTRWSGDVSVVSSGILSLFPNLIIFIFRFFSALLMVVRYDASFAIFAIAGIPISIFISRSSLRRMRKGNMSTLRVNTHISSFNQEAFGNIQTLKAFDMLNVYVDRLKELQKEYSNTMIRYQKMTIMNSMLLTVVAMLVSYSAQGWGVYKVWSGAITYGTMTMFLGLSTTLSGTVNDLLSLFPATISLGNSARRLMEVTGLPKEDYSQKEEVKEFFETHCQDGVGLHVRGVSYAYKNSDDIFIDANVDAFPKETIAFVGPSGEGKTTMLRYLLSIINAKSGEGYICAGRTLPEDGESMMLSASVRQLMAYVPQGNTMFSGTIAMNMRNVKPDATDEDIIDALKMACAWDFIEKLPEGINSEIKERGGGFSEGQAQRIAIARALLRKSPILLLYEATSALDMELERRVLKNIMADDYPRTCIVTTHRPTVLNVCNSVYSIHDKNCRKLSGEEIDALLHDF